MTPSLYWVETGHPGRAAVVTRPRGGTWLADDMRALRAAGVDVLVSALSEREVHEFSVQDEGHAAAIAGIQFLHMPIPNILAPAVDVAAPQLVALATEVRLGRNLAAHCYAGVGRSPLIVASVLALLGAGHEVAWDRVQAARGVRVPDSVLQRNFVSELLGYCRLHALA